MTPTQPQETVAQPPARRGQRLILIVWLFLALVGATLGFAYYSMGVLSAARAFVGGEGLWSKAERDAIYALSRYANTRDARDYQAYTSALDTILGDRQFRLELEKPQPDLQISRQGLLQGRNHPADVDGMIGLFRNFRHMAEIDHAVTLWAEAETSIDHLRIVGERLHTAVQAQTLDAPMASDIQEELHQINLTLAPLADGFSYSLGEASRRAKSILLWTMFVSATLLAAAALVSLSSVSVAAASPAPAQNDFPPAPVITTARISGSFCACCSASPTPMLTAWLTALRASGRVMVTMRVLPRRSVRAPGASALSDDAR